MQSEGRVEQPMRKADGLEMHVVDDQCVVFNAAEDSVHYLNPTAALVLELCDGARTAGEIAALVQEAYGLAAPPLDEVDRCLREFKEMEIVA